MFNLIEYKKHPSQLADKLVWFGFVDRSIILNKTGSLQRTAQLMGFDLDTSSAELLEANCNKLNHIFKQIDSGWALYFDVVRSKSVSYPTSRFPDPLSALIDIERKDRFELENNFFESKYYLTFVYLPPKDREVSLASSFSENTSKGRINRAKDLEDFKKITDSLIESLKFSFLYAKELSDQETATYLHSLISNKKHEVRLPNPPIYLDHILSDTPLLGGLEAKLGNQYFKILTIRFLPNESWPCVLDGLHNLNIEFRWTTRWVVLNKADAIVQIEKKVKGWMSKRLSLVKIVGKMLNITADTESNNHDAAFKQSDAENAKLAVSGNHVGFGYYTATIMVYDSELEQCENKLRRITSLINDQGFVCKEESINAKEAWFGSLPGHTHANIRYPLISTMNLAHFISISSAWAGHKYNKHFGLKFKEPAPLMVTQTEGNTPFRLVLHQGDVGHTLILGPTGQGKSTLLVMMALQFLRYPKAQVFFFDKGFSSKVAAYAVGGAYYQFDRTNNVTMQPLIGIDQPAEREWAESWLQSLIENQGVQLTISHKKELRFALESLAIREPKYRTLLNLKISLQEQDRKMSMALDKFVSGGPYGYLLDGNGGSLASTAWVTFELSQLIETNQDAVEPVLTCLFHKLEQRFDGRPSLLILDEAWTYLKNKTFVNQIQKWLRELRKNEVSVIFASQSLADAIDTPLMSVLLESCQTKIFLPNKEAANPTIKASYEKFGLNESQIQLIASAIPKKQYFYYSSEGVRLFDLAMGELAIAICCNAGKEVSKKCDALLAQYGLNHFLTAWLKHKKIMWAVNLLNNKTINETKEACYA